MHLLGWLAVLFAGLSGTIRCDVDGGLRENAVDPSIAARFGNAIEQLERVGESEEQCCGRDRRKQAIIVSAAATEPLAQRTEGKTRNTDDGIFQFDGTHSFVAARLADTETAGLQLRS